MKTNIRLAVEAGCHVEVTTLVIPGRNDGEDDMKKEAQWLASLSPELPLHISRYFPRWHLDLSPTPVETVYHLAALARCTCQQKLDTKLKKSGIKTNRCTRFINFLTSFKLVRQTMPSIMQTRSADGRVTFPILLRRQVA